MCISINPEQYSLIALSLLAIYDELATKIIEKLEYAIGVIKMLIDCYPMAGCVYVHCWMIVYITTMQQHC